MDLGPDWNEYRKLIASMKKFGMAKQAKMVSGLVRVASSVEKQDFPEASHRLYNDLPQRVKRVDDPLS